MSTAKKTVIKLYKADELDKRIQLLHKSGQSLQAEMHRLACSVLHHLGETSDIRVTLKFLDAMPEMSRSNGLRAWFEAHGPIKFATSEELEQGASAARFVKGGATKLGDAMAKPFWKFNANEGKPYEPLNMEKFTQQMIQRLTKDAKETGADHTALINAIKGVQAPSAPIKVPVDALTGIPLSH